MVASTTIYWQHDTALGRTGMLKKDTGECLNAIHKPKFGPK